MIHEVDVTATSAYEAAAMGYRKMLDDNWSLKSAEEAAHLEVVLPQPPVVHRVSVERLKAFANSAGEPKEMAERGRIKAILEGKG